MGDALGPTEEMKPVPDTDKSKLHAGGRSKLAGIIQDQNFLLRQSGMECVRARLPPGA